MNARKRLTTQRHGNGEIPVPAIAGPLLGLMYLLIFPLVVYGTLARLGGYWAAHVVTASWRKLGHAI